VPRRVLRRAQYGYEEPEFLFEQAKRCFVVDATRESTTKTNDSDWFCVSSLEMGKSRAKLPDFKQSPLRRRQGRLV